MVEENVVGDDRENAGLGGQIGEIVESQSVARAPAERQGKVGAGWEGPLETAKALGACCRGLLRLAAVLLTVLLVAQMAVVSMDLLATQCLAPGSGCPLSLVTVP